MVPVFLKVPVVQMILVGLRSPSDPNGSSSPNGPSDPIGPIQ